MKEAYKNFLFSKIFMTTSMIFILNSCGGGGSDSSSKEAIEPKEIAFVFEKPKESETVAFESLAFDSVEDEAWNILSVQKVLDTFAYGGHATEKQIKLWGDMSASEAIVEMLTFEGSNPLLSPRLDTDTVPATTSLEILGEFWSANTTGNFLDKDLRKRFAPSEWGSYNWIWGLSVQTRGLNPFVHRVGLWESNYHMSINADVGISSLVLLRHYDNIMTKVSENASYDTVIAQGAKNAGVAYQYGHNRNIFVDGQFKGNEDFAREYHQLFLGILGTYDHEYHENIAIPNTARALTDMSTEWRSEEDGGPEVEITFGTENHYSGDLDILNTIIPESPTASAQLEAIAKIGIEHSESLANLPLMIIKHFADENMSSETEKRVQDSWKSMEKKSLLVFLRAYAISSDFHQASRMKYKTSIDRIVSVSNKMIVNNEDNAYQKYEPNYALRKDGVTTFRPLHDVFGHQTALEASDNANIFKVNYNYSIKNSYFYTTSYISIKDENGDYPLDANGDRIAVWEKDWAKIIPKDSDGNYRVKDVALWLWKRFIGDGGKNYGILEKSHLVALLNGKDLGLFLDETKPLSVYDDEALLDNIRINDGEIAKMDLDSESVSERRMANARVGLAIAFIVATPYIYAEEGL